MSESTAHVAAEPHAVHGPRFETYIAVFVALAVCTALSFLANWFFGQGPTSMWIIMVVAVIKATLVAMIFMHLKFDWGRLYCIVIPVSIMAVMMMIVLLPDIVLGWHHINREEEARLEHLSKDAR